MPHKSKSEWKSFLVILLAVLLAGCVAPAPLQTGTNQPVASSIAASTLIPETPTATFTPTRPTATTQPTNTQRPTETAVPSATPTATPAAMTAVTIDWTNVYTGPGETFSIAVAFAGQIKLDVLGKSDDGDWIFVELTPNQSGWVAAQDVQLEAPVEQVAVVDFVPPLPPTVTPSPDLKTRVSAVFDDETKILNVYIQGLTQGNYYIIEIKHENGKILYTRDFFARYSTHYGFGYSNTNLKDGVYVATIYFNDAIVAQTRFTVQRTK